MTTATPKSVDLSRLDDVVGGDTGFAIKIVTMFIKNTAEAVAQLWAMLAEDNRDQLRRDGHKLKGSAAILGADRLAELAGHVEEQALVKELPELQALLKTLDEEFVAVRAQLEAHLQTLGSQP
jgi:HPt (histidine-containing phosphotransfer) domain-containing protein